MVNRDIFLRIELTRSQYNFNYGQTCVFTCVALAKAGLVVGPLRPSVRNTLGVPSLCNL